MQQIKPITQAEEIAWCFEAFKELRPHLNERGTFVQKVIEQQKQGYQIFVISEGGEVVACIGFRIMSMLAWGKILYIDDLITKEKCRGKGYGKALLEHAAHIARHAAHKLYLNQGFEFNCHHLAFKVKQDCLNF
jgi:ribosomal protein S18 acetylase RimI-like enzyme